MRLNSLTIKYPLPPIRQAFLVFIFICALSFALLSPLASNTVIADSIIDLNNHTALIVQAKQALDESQFPIRVTPYEHHGYRYPLFQFYSPLFYNVGGAIYKWITPGNPYLALKLLIHLSFIIGGLFAYRVGKLITQKTSLALLSSALYMCTPYYLITLFVTGAYPEACAIQVIPLILYFTFFILQAPSTKGVNLINGLIFLAVSWMILCLLHTITFFYTSFFMFLFLTSYSALKRQSLPLCYIATAYGVALLGTLWFIAPVYLTKHLLNVSAMLGNPFLFNVFTPLSALLSFTRATPTPHPETMTFYNVFAALGLPATISVISASYLILTQAFHANKTPVYVLLFIFLAALLFLWSPVDIYSVLPNIFQVAQFTYRMLSQTQWITFLLAIYVLGYGYPMHMPLSHFIVILCIILIASSPWIIPLEGNYKTIASIMQSPQLSYASHTYLISEHSIPDMNLGVPIDGTADKACTLREETWVCSITNKDPFSVFMLPALYYPHLLDVRFNGHSLPYFPLVKDHTVHAAVLLPQSSGTLTERFRGLPWANWASAITLILLCTALILNLTIAFIKRIRHGGTA